MQIHPHNFFHVVSDLVCVVGSKMVPLLDQKTVPLFAFCSKVVPFLAQKWFQKAEPKLVPFLEPLFSPGKEKRKELEKWFHFLEPILVPFLEPASVTLVVSFLIFLSPFGRRFFVCRPCPRCTA